MPRIIFSQFCTEALSSPKNDSNLKLESFLSCQVGMSGGRSKERGGKRREIKGLLGDGGPIEGRGNIQNG